MKIATLMSVIDWHVLSADTVRLQFSKRYIVRNVKRLALNMSKYTEQPIIEGKSLNVSNDVSLGKLKANSVGGKNVPIYNTHQRRNLHLSTPLMLTWGVNENDFDGNGKVSYDMSLQFPNEDYKTDNTTQFLDNLIRLET
jgi:hypothetical protein